MNASAFPIWMRRVDGEVRRMTGGLVGVNDLADQTFYDWYEDEFTPSEAAMMTLENEGFPHPGRGELEEVEER